MPDADWEVMREKAALYQVVGGAEPLAKLQQRRDENLERAAELKREAPKAPNPPRPNALGGTARWPGRGAQLPRSAASPPTALSFSARPRGRCAGAGGSGAAGAGARPADDRGGARPRGGPVPLARTAADVRRGPAQGRRPRPPPSAPAPRSSRPRRARRRRWRTRATLCAA